MDADVTWVSLNNEVSAFVSRIMTWKERKRSARTVCALRFGYAAQHPTLVAQSQHMACVTRCSAGSKIQTADKCTTKHSC